MEHHRAVTEFVNDALKLELPVTDGELPMSRLPVNVTCPEDHQRLADALYADPVAAFIWAIVTFSVGDVPDLEYVRLHLSRREKPWTRDEVENALELAKHVRELVNG